MGAPAKKNKKSKSRKPRKFARDSYAIKHKDYLSLLSKSKQKNRRNRLLELANSGEIQAVSECISNILNGNVPISKKSPLIFL